MLRSGKIPVFSNFLIVDPDTGNRSLKWKDEYKETLVDAWIIKDEAWSDIDSTDWKEFTKADNSFFRLSRQNGLVIIIISQTGVVKTVREISNMFVECHCWHFGKFPLRFRRRFRRKYEDKKYEFQKKSFFNPKVGAAYNHRAFRIKRPVNPMTFEPWEGSLPEYFSFNDKLKLKTTILLRYLYINLKWYYDFYTFKHIRRLTKIDIAYRFFCLFCSVSVSYLSKAGGLLG
ncbi:hypothetical protein [Methanosarcina siciliae]|uniref:hypothetical protein n=1 Tax=Methanosarcina siciliae TaxID=38027 RepID=UPI0012E022C9|nr:hypothetical protein [Methanosarcina siciliae]